MRSTCQRRTCGVLAIPFVAATSLAVASGEPLQGWSSASSARFDFRANGTAIPMYIALVPFVVLFVFGLYRLLRRCDLPGGGAGSGTRPWPIGFCPRRVLAGIRRLIGGALFQARVRRRRYSAWVHLPISWGVALLFLGSGWILVDNYLLQPAGIALPRSTGYRIFQALLEIAGLAVLVGTGLAIYRRLRIRPEHTLPDRGTLALLFLLWGLALSGFAMEGLRLQLDGASEPWAFAGSAAASAIGLLPAAPRTGETIYRTLWWLHALAAFAFVAAIPFTKLRHALTAPLNLIAASGRPSGRLRLPFRLPELIAAGCFDVKIGARSLEDFSSRARLALVACAGFGGCHDVCPARATGTLLSPMRLLDELAKGNSSDAGETIAAEAVWSCTLCGACTASCPVAVDPMGYIVELRRGLVADGRLGKQRRQLLAHLAQARNPYGANNAARSRLPTDLSLPTPAERPDAEMLYWIGCASTFDSRARKVARATVSILDAAGIRCAVLGSEEQCCGDAARRLGEEGLFQEMVLRNVELLHRHGIRSLVTHCAHCYNTFRNEYPEFGARLEVLHHTELIESLVSSGRVRPLGPIHGPLTLHDACYVGRFNGGFDAPRRLLSAIPGTSSREMARSGDKAFCCGAGGGNYWYEVPRNERMSGPRIREAEATGARIVVTECPYCLKMLEDARGASPGVEIAVRDVAEVVAQSLGLGGPT